VSEAVRIGELEDRSPGFGMIFEWFPIDETESASDRSTNVRGLKGDLVTVSE
jgi:hypothetical protein